MPKIFSYKVLVFNKINVCTLCGLCMKKTCLPLKRSHRVNAFSFVLFYSHGTYVQKPWLGRLRYFKHTVIKIKNKYTLVRCGGLVSPFQLWVLIKLLNEVERRIAFKLLDN